MNSIGRLGLVGYFVSCKRVADWWTFGRDKDTLVEASHQAMSVVDPDSFEIAETLAANSGIAWVIV